MTEGTPAENSETINAFYRAFSARDHAAMASLYADGASFSDPVFPGLSATEARAMWKMFCERGEDLEITWSDVSATPDTAGARWEARYTFTATGRRVHNRIAASFVLAEGKIQEHRDDFDFYRWARQALGPVGLVLGWTPMVKNKVRSRARGQLKRFMSGSSQDSENS